MKEHDIFALQTNLNRVKYQVDAIANFKKHHDSVRSVFANVFQSPDNAPLGEIVELFKAPNAATSFIAKASSFLTSKWLPLKEFDEALESLESVREFSVSIKGLTEPTYTDWINEHFEATMIFSFGSRQFKASATVTCRKHENTAPRISVSHVEFNYKSIVDIAIDLNKTCKDSINEDKLVEAVFKVAESMFEQHILSHDLTDCSSAEEIRFSLNVLDEIELTCAVDSTSMDILSATRARQVQTLTKKLTDEVEDICEHAVGGSVVISRDLVIDAIEKITH